jgi:hypothetical protein
MTSKNSPASLVVLLSLAAGLPASLFAQDNYEIQVYGSETVPKGETMVELHSNYTAEGREQEGNGVLPTEHAVHETLEVTHGFTPWFETGFYVFTSINPGEGWHWVGDHIRPRVRVPDDWHWPVGLSLSVEAGYQQRQYSEDTWNLELRPIIDKQIGPLYLSVNPAFEKSLAGMNAGNGWDFAPSGKVSFDFTKVFTAGVEYYSSLGQVTHFSDFGDQEHLIVPAIDLNFSPKWEFNFGVGFGLTHSTDHLIFKMIIGRRF